MKTGKPDIAKIIPKITSSKKIKKNEIYHKLVGKKFFIYIIYTINLYIYIYFKKNKKRHVLIKSFLFDTHVIELNSWKNNFNLIQLILNSTAIIT